MSENAARAQRAAALEEKRRRLDDLKKRRERRGEDTAKVKASANLDDYIDGLLKEPGDSSVATATNEAEEISKSVSVDDGASSTIENGDAKSTASKSTTASNVIAEAAPPPPPKIVETFSVATQTEAPEFPDYEEEDEPTTAAGEKADGAQETAAGESATAVEEEDPKILTSEEVAKEVSKQPFSSFINTASKKVERMLGSPLLSDLLVDYTEEKDRGAITTDISKDETKFLSSRQVHECSKWTATRDVTDLDWSPLHRELLLSTYHHTGGGGPSMQTAVSAVAPRDTLSSSLTPRSGELQSDGLALIWSMTLPTRPEHIFTCGSPVTAGRFHPTDSTLVLGGCDSGQLVVWDARSGRLPVQKSALTTVAGASSKGHTHPISSMEIIEGGAGLVTTSLDGRVNFWSLANLREPAESLQVGDSVSCFAVSPESEALLLGDEHGAVYSVPSTQGQRSSRRQAKKLDTTDEDGENFGHYGMVTSLSTKRLKKGATSRAAGLSKGFLRGSGGLVLSSGVDWTVKLWAPAYNDKPLISLVSHSYDYMSDVMWSPTHPSLFATASSNGTVGLWNLATSFEEPITEQDGIVVEPDALSGRGLNRLKWSPDGRRMAVASSDRVHVLSLAEEVTRTKGDEETKIMNQLLTRGLIDRQ